MENYEFILVLALPLILALIYVRNKRVSKREILPYTDEETGESEDAF
jgi:hypothetical protein